jgi:serine/threonine-protein kinase
MAAVYAAQDELLGREVAVKVLAEALGADDDARRRFTREARAAARVSDHPNVVTIYDIAESDGDPPIAFIVMELLTGGTVADRLRAGDAIPHTLALRWLEETAGALDAAHRTGMVHRDVKPANLLLDAHGTLKVADFGIATIANDVPLTRTGQVIGTAAYLSPEQAEGRPATDASDRYALAVVAFELLTGRRPFTADTPAAQAIAHVGTEPPAATAVAPGLPDAVDAVLARGLAKDPAERPVSAAALVSELHAALGPTATTGVAHPTPTEATAVAAAAPMQRLPQRPRTPRTPMPAAPPRTQPHTPRNRARVIGVAAALLVVAGAAIAAVAGSGSDKPVAARSAVDHRAPTAAKQHKPAAKPKAPAATTAAPATTTPAATGAPADAASIQADAHQKILNGDYNGAIGELQGLINRCDVAITDPCAFAWFDLGYALRRAGDPQDAVPVLEHRLQNSNQAGTVQAELDAARAEAAGGGPDKHHGKAKGHDKKDHH